VVAQSLEARTWAVLNAIPDPEIPVISLVDLGIIRHVRSAGDRVEIGVSPTYSGCPATEVIRQDITSALMSAGIDRFSLVDVLAPAWTSDWISERGANALRQYGIAPPRRGPGAHAGGAGLPAICPRCSATDTERVSEFGSTPCKSLYRCKSCLEPFEQFKCI
jgi:ring-1,2-phenylacetyl-CoA epoxidase subunit PaaD